MTSSDAARLDSLGATAAEPPWLSPTLLERLAALERGHQQAFGRPLLLTDRRGTARLRAQQLFASAEVVLAHDGADPSTDPGPRLIYANRAALRLWRRGWDAMVGMPSRLTAEPQERLARSQALVQAQRSGAIRDYGGVRIDSHGRRFQIQGARIWSLIAADGACCGQAAAFENWWWL